MRSDILEIGDNLRMRSPPGGPYLGFHFNDIKPVAPLEAPLLSTKVLQTSQSHSNYPLVSFITNDFVELAELRQSVGCVVSPSKSELFLLLFCLPFQYEAAQYVHPTKY